MRMKPLQVEVKVEQTCLFDSTLASTLTFRMKGLKGVC